MMPTGTGVKRLPIPRKDPSAPTVRRVSRKNADDIEIERRVRAHIRREMEERRIGTNEAGRRLNVRPGTLSKILTEQRGFGSGFILRVMRGFTIPAKLLIDEDPPDRFMAPGVPEEPTPPKKR
jgi:hypothetical protein